MTTIGVVGAGTMGAGIAQTAVEAGDDAILHDIDVGALARARDRIRDGLERRAARFDPPLPDPDGWVAAGLGRLRAVSTLQAVAAGSDLVVEAALEDLGLKQSIMRDLAAAARPDTILATNTSALSVTAIAAATGRPTHVLALHFFNPVPRMALVEVAVTEWTEPAVADRAERIVAAWGKTSVRCADTPGFIVNRVNRPFTLEALRMLEAGQATVEAIDVAMREAGFPMGPFELMDLVGIDINLAAATAVWEGLGRPDRLRPSPVQEALVAEGRLGRKSGRGFYRYLEDRRGPAEVAGPATSVSLDRAAIQDRIASAVRAEALRAAEDGIATADDIALALRLGAGHPRDPFAPA